MVWQFDPVRECACSLTAESAMDQNSYSRTGCLHPSTSSEHAIAAELAKASLQQQHPVSLTDEELALALADEERRQSGGGCSPSFDMYGSPPYPASEDEMDEIMAQQLATAEYIKHVPRVNSSTPATPGDEFTNRQRLQLRLQMYGLCEREVKGDGNCQFRALSDQLYRTPHYHAEVRRVAVNQLRAHEDLYSDYVPGDYWQYCADMARNGTWGDHVTLQAVADAYGVRINVMTSFEEACFIELKPLGPVRSQRVVYLSFWAEVHYNSLYPANDPPAQIPEHKFLGSRRLHRFFSGSVHNELFM